MVLMTSQSAGSTDTQETEYHSSGWESLTCQHQRVSHSLTWVVLYENFLVTVKCMFSVSVLN